MVQDSADLAGRCVDGMFGAVAAEAYGAGAAAQGGELAGRLGHGAEGAGMEISASGGGVCRVMTGLSFGRLRG
ncbi:hypothetical protein [Streptomyces poriticola]|uniref:hypothetical protein n=1 Tax=Streptomyces poriticola TaxID=3120506 RepID=UPI0038CD21A4